MEHDGEPIVITAPGGGSRSVRPGESISLGWAYDVNDSLTVTYDDLARMLKG